MIQYKIAESAEELDKIYSLNYRTFVEEIPQHSQNEAHQLIDRFDKENEYIIALNEQEELVGMVCIRDQRPFSLDSKLDNLDHLLPVHDKKCEIRLMAVRPDYRKTGVFRGLVQKLFEIAAPRNYDIALISGTDRQQELYKSIGFKVFADAVGTQEALYYPMYLDIKKISSQPFFI